MNFLAHIYLSGDNHLVKIGNFSADAVKGSHYLRYPRDMQIGILLHRFIDDFTDRHPTFRTSKRRLQPKYGLYSGVIIDIFYDHLLAKNWNRYHPQPLGEYVSEFYGILQDHFELLPERFQYLTPFMIEDNWLLSYANIDGIQRVLNGMHRRTKGRSKMNEATEELQMHYQDFERDFFTFFEALQNSSENKLIELQTLYDT